MKQLKMVKIIFIIITILVLVILKNTNLLKKIRGNVLESNSVVKETKESTCDVESISNSYIKITGTIDQDYGEDGLATITFTDGNKSFTKELEVKTNSKTKLDFTLSKGEYNLTISKEGYDVYEGKINTSQELNITLHNKNVGDVVATGQVGDNVYYNYYSNGLLQLKGTGDMWDGINNEENINYNLTILNDILINKIEENVKLSEEEKGFLNADIMFGYVLGRHSEEYMLMILSSKEGLENGMCPDESNSDCDIATSFMEIFGEEKTKIILETILNMNIPVNTKVVISDGITSLGSYSLSGVQSNELIIPDSITNYGKSVIMEAGIERLILSKSVKVIPPEFASNIGLRELIIPNGVEEIQGSSDYGAFSCNELTSLNIPRSVRILGGFYDNNITSLNVPGSVTKILANSFGNNSLKELIISNGVEEIENRAFWRNNLTSVKIPNSVNNIGSNAFSYNQITNAILPSNIRDISAGLFYDNKLSTIKIPNGVTRISSYAFYKNQLVNIDIPASVNLIGNEAFRENNLTNINIKGEQTRFNSAWNKIGFPLDLKP